MLRHDKPVIKWLELAVSPRWQNGRATATVHSMRVDADRSCFGVRLEQRWLCGSDGGLTCFDSISAATRFLQLLNIDRVAEGARYDGADLGREHCQCFLLGGRGLTPCNRCPIGEEAPSVSRRGHALWDDDERW